jgi:hypothetical protein
MSIHYLVLEKIREELQTALIDNVDDEDTRAGIVMVGPLQGDPDPDEARIAVQIFENDPDAFYGIEGSALDGAWNDEVHEVEIGQANTWIRRFSIKARCLLDLTGEDKDTARQTASTVRTRIEHLLPRINFGAISSDGEYVSRRIVSEEIKSEMIQGGGPPDAYDFSIKIRFSIKTTEVIT